MNRKKTKNIQKDIIENAHKIWLAGLGAVAVAEEEGSKFFKNLVEKGETVEGRGKEQLEKAKGAATGVKTVAESYWDTFGQTLDDKLTGVINRLGVPTKDEIDGLNKKVAELTKAVDNLRVQQAKPAAAKPAAKPAVAKKPAAVKKPAATKKATDKPTTTTK